MNPTWYFLFGVWFTFGCCVAIHWCAKRQDDLSPEAILKVWKTIESRQEWLRKLDLAIWRWKHRKGCYPSRHESENIFPPELRVSRRELVSTKVIPANKIIVRTMGLQVLKCNLWKQQEFYFRLSCPRCGRLHFRHVSHYSPADE